MHCTPLPIQTIETRCRRTELLYRLRLLGGSIPNGSACTSAQAVDLAGNTNENRQLEVRACCVRLRCFRGFCSGARARTRAIAQRFGSLSWYMEGAGNHLGKPFMNGNLNATVRPRQPTSVAF